MSNSPQDDATERTGPDTGNAPAPSSANFQLSQDPVTAEKTAPPAPNGGGGNAMAAPAYEHLGELPTNYGRQAVYLVAYDPHRLYAYWDLDWNKLPTGSRDSLAVRVLHADSGEEESRSEIARTDTGRYLPVQRVGGTYVVELGSGGGPSSSRPWRPLAVSDRVTMPPEDVAADEENGGEVTQFATLPFHVSFQRLTDMLREAMAAGEHLTGAIARLQRAGSGLRGPAASAMTSALASLSGEERRNLATLFGWNPDAHGASSGGLSSGQSGSGQGGIGGFGGGAVTGAGGAGGSEALSSAALLGGAPSSLSSAALSSAALLRQLAALGAGGSEARELFSAALYAAAGAGASGVGSGGLSSAGAGALSRPGPSSEKWRFGAAGAHGSGAPGKDNETFVRERAERFIRSITSSLDVLGSAFRSAGAGASDTSSSRGKW